MAATRKLNIMLVDDSTDTLTTLSQGLRRHGLNVSAFSDPQLALSEYKPDHYDMIVLDLSMPGMNGFDLAGKILAKDPDAHICFLSAFESHEVESKMASRLGKSVSYIGKPKAPSEIAKHIVNQLQKRPARSK